MYIRKFKSIFFNSEPLVVCLNDVREWLVFYPFIRSIVLVEALKEYKKNGLSYLNYFILKMQFYQIFYRYKLYTFK